ncbi:MAG: InlB B-repeat-containing protein, partial [Paludibacteraceae bacterium]|nr:InlB B-repeat-containing protein [Paludibacteraceae bacterium]
MKKFTLLVAALAISLVTFAQGTITYNLNGGVTNDFGWKNKGDMFADFMADNGATDFETLEYYKAQTDPLGSPNICDKLTTCAAMVSNAEKWGWLKTYIQAVTAAQAADSPSALDETCATAAWRYAAGAFFVDGQRASWPKSADFSIAGQLASFQPTWKAGFCGPAEYAEGETVVLPIPYKEGESFLGWFKEADFSGEKVTEISGTGDVVLYAKFGEYIPTIAEVIAMADATATKVQGTVSFVAGNNFWIQDASAAILCYGENHGLVEGELATLAGEKVVSNGSPMLNNATVAAKEAGKEVGAQTLLLS